MAGSAHVRFGVFELDLHARELRKRGIRLKLQEQPLQVLEALLQRPGEMVTREELEQKIWPGGTFVDFDQSLNRAVNKLREALGDAAGIPRFIETLPRRGYRFIAPVGEPSKTEPPRFPEPGAASVQSRGGYRPLWMFITWVGAGILTAAVIQSLVREKPAPIPVMRMTLGPPDHTSFLRTEGAVRSIALSPDGRRIVFSVKSGPENQLWLRSLDEVTAQPLAGTENAIFPFWSPDSRSIGFATGGKLKRLGLAGGPVVTLADAPGFGGGTWNRDGLILFAPYLNGPLQLVEAAGEYSNARAGKVQPKSGELRRWPWFLPDGKHYLYATPRLSRYGRFTILAGSLDSPETRFVLEAESNAIFVGEHLLFVRESSLMAQTFDSKKLTTRGSPITLAENIGCLSMGKGAFSASENGVLLYSEIRQNQLTWLDRYGTPLSALGDPGLLGRLHLSPDRKKVAVAVTAANNTNIWIYEVANGLRTRFPLDPGMEMIGVWSPDGRNIIFDSNRQGRHNLYRRAADGTGGEELIYADDLEKGPTSWSSDGRTLLYNALSPKSGWDIWALPLKENNSRESPQPQPFLLTAFNEQQGQFSPDGQWVLYQSNESGRGEIYVTRFPVPREKRRVSPNGGIQPRWRQDGREIFYLAPDGTLTAVPVSARRAALEIGEPHKLFGPLTLEQGFAYDVADNGRRFLAEISLPGNVPAGKDLLFLVQNWVAGLKKLLSRCSPVTSTLGLQALGGNSRCPATAPAATDPAIPSPTTLPSWRVRPAS